MASSHSATTERYLALYRQAKAQVRGDHPEWSEERVNRTARSMVDAHMSGHLRG